MIPGVGVDSGCDDLPEPHRDLFQRERARISRVVRAALDQGLQRNDPFLVVVSTLWSRVGIGLVRARWGPADLKSELSLARTNGLEPSVVEGLVGDDVVELLDPWPEAIRYMRQCPAGFIPVMLAVADHVVLTIAQVVIRGITAGRCE